MTTDKFEIGWSKGAMYVLLLALGAAATLGTTLATMAFSNIHSSIEHIDTAISEVAKEVRRNREDIIRLEGEHYAFRLVDGNIDDRLCIIEREGKPLEVSE